MKIGDIDIRTYNAKQLTVEFVPPDMPKNTEWLDGAATPHEYKGYLKYGKLRLSLLLRGSGRGEIVRTASEMLREMAKTVSLSLDGYKGSYEGKLVKSSLGKTKMATRFLLDLEFDGYLADEAITHIYDGVTTAVFETLGTRDTPCILEITPKEELASLTVSGFGEDDIILSELAEGKTIIIDGEKGTATIDGENMFDKVDLWAFPILHPRAKTTVRFSSAMCEVKIRYRPMWL